MVVVCVLLTEGNGIRAMNVKQLREALEEAAGIFAAAGANKQNDEIQAFLEIFRGHDGETVTDFLAGLRKRLSEPEVAAGKTGRKADDLIVGRYVQRLRKAGTDKIAFDSVFADLSEDRAVGKEEADAIAHQYTEGRAQWRKRGDALREIKTRFSERAYQAVKMMRVDKASRW